MPKRSQVDLPLYSTRLDDALALAADAFRHRVRKGSGIPYLTHLMAVAVIVAEHGGDEDMVIAALLHDYLEDIHGASADELEERFGRRVRELVLALSDSTTHPKPPWDERKKAYIAHLRQAGPDVRLLAAADKLHNVRSILRDHETIGAAVFDRFTATRDQTVWYYDSVVAALSYGWEHRVLTLLTAEVARLGALAND